MEQARAEGDYETSLRYMTLVLRLMATADEQQRAEAAELQEQTQQLTDAQLECRRREAVLQVTKQDPEAIAAILREAGWTFAEPRT